MGAKEEVNIKVSADMAEALTAWKEIGEGPLALEAALKRIGQLEGNTSDKWTKALEGVVGKWFSIAAAIAAAKSALEAYHTARKQLGEDRVDATQRIDSAFTRYLATSGIERGSDQATAEYSRIARIGAQAGNVPGGFDAAALGASFGVRDDAALSAMLQLQEVSAQTGTPIDQRRLLEFMKRSGTAPTAQNFQGLGGTLFSLLNSNTGFTMDRLDEYTSVAAPFAERGYDQATGLAMFNEMRRNQENRFAVSEARRLLDDTVEPGERERLAQLQRGGQAAIASAGSYGTAVDVVEGSVTSRGQRSQAGSDVANYRPGAISRDEVSKRLASLMGQAGLGDQARIAIQAQFDNPLGPDYLYSTEGLAQRASYGLVDPNLPLKQAERQRRGVVDQLMGRQEIPIRLLGPDGRDLPIQVEAEALNSDFSNDTTQSTNFRP